MPLLHKPVGFGQRTCIHCTALYMSGAWAFMLLRAVHPERTAIAATVLCFNPETLHALVLKLPRTILELSPAMPLCFCCLCVQLACRDRLAVGLAALIVHAAMLAPIMA